ncbi:MAG TPA: hypothetical protein VG410_09545 [Solirubrobacteraceae bacterium]|nr:hypothetical protein [Solirubrobacteraceae bacterium]
MRVARIGGALAAAALTVAIAPAASGQTLTFNVSTRPARELDSRRPVPAIALGFTGVSIDYCNITQYADAGPNPILDQLVLALAPQGGVIRIGGDQLGQGCAGDADPLVNAPPVIRSVLRQTQSRAILGVDFADGDPYLVPGEVSALIDALDRRHPSRWIEAFEIGNEPDLYQRYGVALPWQQTQPSFFQYLQAFTEWAGLIHRYARDPDVGVAGPSLGRLGIPWIHGPFTHDFRAFMSGPAEANPITFHEYALLWQVACPNPGCPTIVNLLTNSASHGLAQQVAPYSAWLRDPQQVRVDEANSVTGGGVSGVSNTFSSALWMLDTLFEFAQAGVGGVNVHTFPSAQYALFSGPRPGGWLVYPEYYGMLAFARAAPFASQLLSVSRPPATDAAPPVKVWAVQTLAGSLHVVAINKDLVPRTIVLDGPGVPYAKTATISVLRAPPTPPSPTCPVPLNVTGLCARSGVTLAGATFGAADAAGGDHTSTGALGGPARGTCTRLEACTAQPRKGEIELTLAPGTATMLSGSPAPRPSPRRRAKHAGGPSTPHRR